MTRLIPSPSSSVYSVGVGAKKIHAEHNFTATPTGELINLPDDGLVFLQFWGDHASDIFLSTSVDGTLGPRAMIAASEPAEIGPLALSDICPKYLSGATVSGTVTVWVIS